MRTADNTITWFVLRQAYRLPRSTISPAGLIRSAVCPAAPPSPVARRNAAIVAVDETRAKECRRGLGSKRREPRGRDRVLPAADDGNESFVRACGSAVRIRGHHVA